MTEVDVMGGYLELLTYYTIDVPAPTNIGQPVVEDSDVITVDDDVIHDVIVLEFAGCRVAEFDVAAKSVWVVVDGVAGPSQSFGDTRVEDDVLVTAGPQVRARDYR